MVTCILHNLKLIATRAANWRPRAKTKYKYHKLVSRARPCSAKREVQNARETNDKLPFYMLYVALK